MPTTFSASDSLSLGDSVVVQLGTPVSRAGGDNLFFSDSFQARVDLLSNPSDSLSLSDGLQIRRSIALSLSDALALGDSAMPPILAVELKLLLSDSLSLSDESSISFSTQLDEYLRRYLNDVS